MATQEEIKKARELWMEKCKEIQRLTEASLIKSETPDEKRKRITRLLGNYQEFCEFYFPHYMTRYDESTGKPIKSTNAPFHNEAARMIRNNPNFKGVIKWPRGHAKSTHMAVFTPSFLMFQTQPLFHLMVLVGKSEDAAEKLLGDIQAELENNRRLIADFGVQKSIGDWQEGSFSTTGGISFEALGRGQSPRGLRVGQYRPDYILIDDLDDDELSRNPRRVREMTAWVKEALFGSLDVGRGRFIMVGNLISKNSVLYAMTQNKKMTVSTVYAVDKDGNPTWPSKWTKEEAQEYKDFVGYASWEKEMMHNPITSGSIFKHEWIRYKKILPLHKYEEIICYTDPSFKSSRSSDYKASRLWGRTGKELHLLDCYVRQDTIGGMVRWLYDLHERLPENVTVAYYMEANFMQDMILDEFEAEGLLRGYQLPIIGDKRKKPDKLQRIQNISPLWERGLVYYNEALKDSPDMKVGIEQTLALEPGSTTNDDAPDADEGAIYKLQRSGRQARLPIRTGGRGTPRNSW